MKYVPIGENELKVGMRVKGINEITNIIEYIGTIVDIDNEGRNHFGVDENKECSIERDDGATGSGITLPGYGSTWVSVFQPSKNIWSDNPTYLVADKINWKERLTRKPNKNEKFKY